MFNNKNTDVRSDVRTDVRTDPKLLMIEECDNKRSNVHIFANEKVAWTAHLVAYFTTSDKFLIDFWAWTRIDGSKISRKIYFKSFHRKIKCFKNTKIIMDRSIMQQNSQKKNPQTFLCQFRLFSARSMNKFTIPVAITDFSFSFFLNIWFLAPRLLMQSKQDELFIEVSIS